MQVVEVNAIEHLEAIRLNWTALLYKTPSASFFHTLDWIKLYWQHDRRGRRLRVLLVYHRGTLLGILPLVLQREVAATGVIDILTYPTRHPNQFHGPIGPDPSATLMASLRYLASRSRDWDLLSLTDIGEHDRGRTANAMQLAGFCPRDEVRSMLSKIGFDQSRPQDATESGPGLAEKLPDRESHIPSELTFERLRPLGHVYGDDELLSEIAEECAALNRGESSRQSPLATSATFLGDWVTTASRVGMLDLNLLRCHGRLIAYSLNVHFDGALQQILVGEDASVTCHASAVLPGRFLSRSERRRDRPRDILMQRMLEDSLSRGDRHFEVNEAIEGISSPWATQHVSVARHLYCAAPPLLARLTRRARRLFSPPAHV